MLMAAQHQHGEGGVSLFIINLLIQPENCRVHYQQTYLVYGPTFDTNHISHSVYFIKQILGAQLPKTLTGQTYSSEVHANILSVRPQIPGDTPRKIGYGCAALFPKPITLFMTKICNFPYLIYGLTKI